MQLVLIKLSDLHCANAGSAGAGCILAAACQQPSGIVGGRGVGEPPLGSIAHNLLVERAQACARPNGPQSPTVRHDASLRHHAGGRRRGDRHRPWHPCLRQLGWPPVHRGEHRRGPWRRPKVGWQRSRDLPARKPSIQPRGPAAPSSQGVAIPMIEKKFSTINIPDVSEPGSLSPGAASGSAGQVEALLRACSRAPSVLLGKTCFAVLQVCPKLRPVCPFWRDLPLPCCVRAAHRAQAIGGRARRRGSTSLRIFSPRPRLAPPRTAVQHQDPRRDC